MIRQITIATLLLTIFIQLGILRDLSKKSTNLSKAKVNGEPINLSKIETAVIISTGLNALSVAALATMG